jgi:endonuclease III
VAKARPGARQPLAQQRPKLKNKLAGKPTTAVGKRSRDEKIARGGPPPKPNIPSGSRPAATKKALPVSKSRPAKAARAAPTPEFAAELYRRLAESYPDAHCELDYASAWQLLVATILSAQCTDKRVNMVTPVLFATYPTPAAMARARQEDVEEIIKSTGFFRNKAKAIIAMSGALVEQHGGEVPNRMESLVVLPGVGRKTANVVLGNAFNINEGVVVDTHVTRLSRLLGLTTETDPVRIEQDLARLFSRDQWTMLSHLLIWHGRRVCDARKPRCDECVLAAICPSAFLASIGNPAKKPA